MNKELRDKLKTISFVLVVFVVISHAYNLTISPDTSEIINNRVNWFIQNALSDGLAKIASPLFFSISGFLFYLSMNNGSFNEFPPKLRKRFKTLVIPYLLWSIYGLLLYLTLQSIPFSKAFFTNELISNLSFIQILNIILLQPIPYHLWFVRDLTMLVLISPLLYWLIKNFNYYILTIFIIFWINDIDFEIFISRSLLFFSAGAFISINKINLSTLKSVNPYFVTIIWIGFVLLKTTLQYQNSEYVWLVSLLHKASLLLGIISIWMIYDYIFKNRDISNTRFYTLFQFSFFLFAFHEPTLTIIKKSLNYLMGQSELNSFLVYIIAPLATIFFSLVIGNYMKRVVPKFYYLLTGGR